MDPVRKYEQIAELLRAEIAPVEGAGRRSLASERTLASRHAVDRSTIRRALDLLQEEGLISRQAGRRTSIASANDRAPGTGRRRQVAFVARATPRGWATLPLLEGAESVLTPMGFDLTFYPLTATDAFAMERQEQERLDFCRSRGFSGVVYWPQTGRGAVDSLTRLSDAGIPVVLVDQHLPHPPVDFAGVDSVAAAYRATEHLIRAGHKHIAHVTRANTMPTTGQRAEGYRRAMEDYSRPVCEEWTVRGQVGRDEETLRATLALRPRPTALFAINDLTALALLNGLVNAGVRVPEDIAIVGIDDLPVSREAVVPLTTVRQPFREIGAESARLLIGRMTSTSPSGPLIRYLGAELVVRASCGTAQTAAQGTRQLVPAA